MRIRKVELNIILKKRRRALGLSQAAVAILAGMTTGNYQRLESGESKTTAFMVQLARALKTTAEDLLSGIDTPLDGGKIADIDRVRRVPILEMDEVENYLAGKYDYKIGINMILPNEIKGKFVVKVAGDSMESPGPESRSLRHDDRVSIDTDEPLGIDNLVLVMIGGQPKIRRYIIDGTEKILTAFNPKYPNIPVTEEVKILGVLTENWRPLK